MQPPSIGMREDVFRISNMGCVALPVNGAAHDEVISGREDEALIEVDVQVMREIQIPLREPLFKLVFGTQGMPTIRVKEAVPVCVEPLTLRRTILISFALVSVLSAIDSTIMPRALPMSFEDVS